MTKQEQRAYVDGLHSALSSLEDWIDTLSTPEYIEVFNLFHFHLKTQIDALSTDVVAETTINNPQLLLELEG
jgi:hypothetical protein